MKWRDLRRAFSAIISDGGPGYGKTAAQRLLHGVEFRNGFVSWRQTSGREREVIGHANFDSAFGSQLVGMAVGIDGSSRQALRRDKFWHACGEASGALSEAGYRLLQMLDVFIHAQRTQMLHRVFSDLLILSRLVSRRPQHSGRLIFAGMLSHLRSKNFQERMSIRNVGTTLERFFCVLVILEFHVIDETEVIVKFPVVGIVLNPVLHQRNGALGLAGTLWRFGRKEAAAKLVSDQEMRVQVRGDFEKRRQQVVAGGVAHVPAAEILHGASPINACHQAVITETGALDYRRRTEEEDFIKRGLRTQLVGAMKHEGTGSQRQDEACSRDHRSFLALLHFKVIS